VRCAIDGDKLKKEMTIRVKCRLLQRQSNNAMFDTIKVTDLKIAMGKLDIPAYAVKQFLNRLHDIRVYSRRGGPQELKRPGLSV